MLKLKVQVLVSFSLLFWSLLPFLHNEAYWKLNIWHLRIISLIDTLCCRQMNANVILVMKTSWCHARVSIHIVLCWAGGQGLIVIRAIMSPQTFLIISNIITADHRNNTWALSNYRIYWAEPSECQWIYVIVVLPCSRSATCSITRAKEI